jgi:Abnormal spindle-like microcephaly-assoc'd, ASPM-SPD-2-Hydin/Beta-propeller repeat
MVPGFRTLRHLTQFRPIDSFFSATLLRGMPRIGGVAGLLLAIAVIVQPAKSARPTAKPVADSAAVDKTKAISAYGKLPLSFEPNQGQIDGQVRFISRGPGYTLFLADTEAVFSLRQANAHTPQSLPGTGAGQDLDAAFLNSMPKQQPVQDAVLRVQFVGSQRNAAVTGLDKLPGKTNYIHGNDPAKWTTNIPSYAKLQYSNVFQGVDLVYYGNQRQLEYDFVVSGGADPGQISLNFNGARDLHVDQHTGDLVMTVGRQEVRFHQPVAYQVSSQQVSSQQNANEAVSANNGSVGTGNDSRKDLVAARYRLDSLNHVGFELGNYDHSRPLVIDPTLVYSSYLGGASNDYATAITVDGSGNAYLTGYTSSVNFPVTAGAYQTACSGGCSGSTSDAFVSKLDPTGSFLIYSTYLGGSGNDYGNGIAIDAAGDAYIAGQTYSLNFPVTKGSFQSKCGGTTCSGGDAFVTELNPEGSALIYSTYLGGKGTNQANSIVLDASNNAYITGYTQSLTFPVTTGAFQTTCSCSTRSVVFLTKLNSTGSALIYSTYLGGSGGDVGYAVVLDSSGSAYLTGYTHSNNFPVTAGAFQTKLNATSAGFVTKMNSTGSALIYSTYVGGTSTATTPCEACGTNLTVDSSGDAYVCGLTAESTFPVTPGAVQTTFMSSTNGHDAFITKLNSTGTALIFSTYLGGTGDDGATGIAVDASDNVWLRGNTKSTNFPVTPGAFQTTNAGAFDAWVAEINSTGSVLLYSTYLGGSGTEYGGATNVLAIDKQLPPNVYVTGYTDSTDFPVTAGSLQAQNAGENDGFVTKFAPSPNIGLSAGLNFGNENDGTTSAPQTITVTNTGNENLNVTNVSITGPNSGDFNQTNTCTTNSVAPQSTCTITVTFTPSITGNESASVSLTDNAPASPQAVSLTGFGIGSGPAVELSATSLTFPLTLVGTQSKAQTVTLTNVGNATLTISNIAPSANFTETNTCGTSVAVNGSCTITITFKPTVPNAITGSVTITDNAAGSPQAISLSGTGTVVTLSPATLNFGPVTVGQTSSPKLATLRNSSTSALAITIATSGNNPSDFPETNTCGSSVPAGGTCTFSITFKPAAKGLASASLSVTDSGGGSPQMVTLIGTGQ